MLSRILGTARARAAVLTIVAAGTLGATPAYAGTATFSGTITDSVTGETVGGVCVLLYKEEGDTAYEQYPDVCTDTDGRWTVTDLEPGTYFVQASGWGYVRQYAYGHDHLWEAERFTVADGESVTVDLAMERAGEVVGTVTDAASGEPIPGVCAHVQGTESSDSGCTGDDGTYSVFVRPGSDYRIYFSDWAGAHTSEYAHDAADWDTAQVFTVVAGEQLVVDEDLAASAAISGWITDAATGTALSGVCVMALAEPEGDFAAGHACSDEEGHYKVTAPAGSYHVVVDDESGAHPRTWYPGTTDPAASTTVTVEEGADTSGVDFALSPAAYVSGTVTNATTGEPATDVCVNAVRPSDGAYIRNPGPAACTDAEGRYTLGGLPTGDVKVFFNPISFALLPQWAYGQETEETAALIPVVAGETTTGVDAAMKTPGAITGRVVDAKTKQPLEGVCATVGVYSHRSGENGTQWPSACTGPDGRYKIEGLPTGSYTVEFYDPEGAWAWQFFPNKADRVQAARLDVTTGQTLSGINAKMSRGGTVEGLIVDEATGLPADGVCLDGYTARQHDPFGTGWCTGPDGRYVLRGLPTTKIKISLFDGGGGYDPEWAYDKPSFETATPIATRGGATTTAADITVSRP